MTRRQKLILLLAVVVCAVVATVVLFVVDDDSDRPRELAVAKVSPCELISEVDLKRLDAIDQPQVGSTLEFSEEGPGCEISIPTGRLLGLTVIANHGVDRWTDGEVGGETSFEDVARIRGFRVIKVTAPVPVGALYPRTACRLYVDVADGQSLKVTVGERPTPEESDPPVCEVARQAAEAAMRTLTSR